MKYTREEKSWILYDVANSAFVLLLSTTIPIYFSSLVTSAGKTPAEATGIFALATSIAVLVVALLAPILGAIADFKGMKKKLFFTSLMVGIMGGISLVIAESWQAFIFVLILARIGYSLCNVFYDSMLTDVTHDDQLDQLSGMGYAFGSIGSTIPFIIGLMMILNAEALGLTTVFATKISFLISVFWWALLSIPLLKNVRQVHYHDRRFSSIGTVFKNLGHTVRKIWNNKRMRFFIIAYFCYIDGVYTIISQSAIFGAEVGIDSNLLLIALLLTQFVAFPFAILSGKLAKRFGQLTMLSFYIAIYMVVAIIGFFLSAAWQFWLLAFLVGSAQGGIQSLSRSYFSRLVPKQESNEFFGFFDIFGKFADFFGPLLLAISVSLFGSSRYGILALIVLFAIGVYFLQKINALED